MSTTIAPPAPSPEPAKPSMSAISRIFGVFFSPKTTFEDIARRPSWVAPLALLIVVYMGLCVVLAQRVNWYEVSKEQIAKNRFAAQRIDQLDDALKERVFQQAAKRGEIGRYVRGCIGWPLLLLVSSAVYLLAFKLIGGARTNFATTFAIATFAHLPVGLKELLAVPVTLMKDPNAIDPDNFLASNPAAIIGGDLPLWQTVSLTFLDVFSIWALVLVAVGFSAADPKKMRFGKALGISFGVWAFFVSFFTGLAWIFS